MSFFAKNKKIIWLDFIYLAVLLVAVIYAVESKFFVFNLKNSEWYGYNISKLFRYTLILSIWYGILIIARRTIIQRNLKSILGCLKVVGTWLIVFCCFFSAFVLTSVYLPSSYLNILGTTIFFIGLGGAPFIVAPPKFFEKREIAKYGIPNKPTESQKRGR